MTLCHVRDDHHNTMITTVTVPNKTELVLTPFNMHYSPPLCVIHVSTAHGMPGVHAHGARRGCGAPATHPARTWSTTLPPHCTSTPQIRCPLIVLASTPQIRCPLIVLVPLAQRSNNDIIVSSNPPSPPYWFLTKGAGRAAATHHLRYP